jgi:hypothetical protein
MTLGILISILSLPSAIITGQFVNIALLLLPVFFILFFLPIALILIGFAYLCGWLYFKRRFRFWTILKESLRYSMQNILFGYFVMFFTIQFDINLAITAHEWRYGVLQFPLSFIYSIPIVLTLLFFSLSKIHKSDTNKNNEVDAPV